MYPFIETIRIEDGVIHHIDYHNERLNSTRSTFWQNSRVLNLSDYIQIQPEQGILKCRVVYNEDVQDITYTPYLMRQVHSLQIVESDTIDYPHKSTDREAINQLFAQRGDADDVLIVKRGILTDTSIANIALYDGYQWYTPKQPLLKGTQRASLLSHQLITEKEISLQSLCDYSLITLFNAMIDFQQILIPMDHLLGKVK